MRQLIFSLPLAIALLFAASDAGASGRTTNSTYKTARAAAIRVGAYEMNQSRALRGKLGTITGRRTVDRGVVSTSPTGVSERHLVETRKQGPQGGPAASTIVSVRKTVRGWVAYTGGSSKVVIAPGL